MRAKRTQKQKNFDEFATLVDRYNKFSFSGEDVRLGEMFWMMFDDISADKQKKYIYQMRKLLKEDLLENAGKIKIVGSEQHAKHKH